MQYLESEKIKNRPELYKGIKESISWISQEPFIYDYFEKNISKKNTILDIGCGNGYFLNMLKNQGFANLHGADMANYSKDKSFDHQSLDINKEKLKWQDNFFNVITAFQILEHLENYFLILQEATRVLKKGGLFIFSVPNQFNIFYRFKFFLTGNITGWDLDNNHLLFLTKDVFKKTYLRDFDLIDVYYRKGPVPMLGRLNIIPGIKFKAKTRILPRNELLTDKACYILRKK